MIYKRVSGIDTTENGYLILTELTPDNNICAWSDLMMSTDACVNHWDSLDATMTVPPQKMAALFIDSMLGKARTDIVASDMAANLYYCVANVSNNCTATPMIAVPGLVALAAGNTSSPTESYLIAASSPSGISVWENPLGTAPTAAPAPITLTGSPSALAVGDIDGNGTLDIVGVTGAKELVVHIAERFEEAGEQRFALPIDRYAGDCACWHER